MGEGTTACPTCNGVVGADHQHMHGNQDHPCTPSRFCVSPQWPICRHCGEHTPLDSQCGNCLAA
eukprot:1243309-Karenia_brevis.AAC.1